MINNKLYPLKINTYEKSGQAVHPSLLYQPNDSFPFILSFTPYPFTMDYYENPSILVSRDGINFFEEKPGLNPIVPAPSFDHNDDPDLFIYEGKYNILYLETQRPEKQNIVLLTSQDRINWISRIIHTDYLTKINPDPFVVSPAFFSNSSGDYLFYVLKNENKNNEIEFVNVYKGFNPDFLKRKKVTIELNGHNPWHISIIKYDHYYYMLITCVNKKKYNLFIAKYKRVEEWDFHNKVLLKNTYRSTGFLEKSNIFIYYSKPFFLNAWGIGVTKINLNDYFTA